MVGQALIATLEVSLGRHFTEPVSGWDFGIFEILEGRGLGNGLEREGRRKVVYLPYVFVFEICWRKEVLKMHGGLTKTCSVCVLLLEMFLHELFSPKKLEELFQLKTLRCLKGHNLGLVELGELQAGWLCKSFGKNEPIIFGWKNAGAEVKNAYLKVWTVIKANMISDNYKWYGLAPLVDGWILRDGLDPPKVSRFPNFSWATLENNTLKATSNGIFIDNVHITLVEYIFILHWWLVGI